MPFINTKVSTKISRENELKLKERFGKAISLLRGKSEAWLMLNFEDECRMYFQGDGEQPCAFIEVKIYGRQSADEYDALTAELSEIVSQVLGINKGKIYVKYEEIAHWGFNGHNF